MAVRKILIKRAYEAAEPHDGYRVLVDRLWPRGLTKQALPLDDWNKDVAPSTELRQWFGHDPKRWGEFLKRYRKELSSAEQRKRLETILKAAGRRNLTLVYGAKDLKHNHALVLQAALEKARLTKTAPKKPASAAASR